MIGKSRFITSGPYLNLEGVVTSLEGETATVKIKRGNLGFHVTVPVTALSQTDPVIISQAKELRANGLSQQRVANLLGQTYNFVKWHTRGCKPYKPVHAKHELWSPQQRANALQRIFDGETVKAISDQIGIPQRTLFYWKSLETTLAPEPHEKQAMEQYILATTRAKILGQAYAH